MRLRVLLAVVCAGLGLFAALVLAAGLWLAAGGTPDGVVLWVGAPALAGAAALAYLLPWRRVARPLALAERRGIEITMTGLPPWLYCDGHALMLAIEALIERLSEHSGVTAFDVEPVLAGHRISIDIAWAGDPLPDRLLEEWLAAPIEAAPGCASIGAVLDLHGSQADSRQPRPGRATLHLPVPATSEPAREAHHDELPPRPEFYDFDLLRRNGTQGGSGGRPGGLERAARGFCATSTSWSSTPRPRASGPRKETR